MNSKCAIGGAVLLIAVATRTVVRAADDAGKRLYESHCSQCHGSGGQGRGTMAPSLVPFKWSDQEALELVRRPLCDMPPVPESALSDSQVAQIVGYLRSIE